MCCVTQILAPLRKELSRRYGAVLEARQASGQEWQMVNERRRRTVWSEMIHVTVVTKIDDRHCHATQSASLRPSGTPALVPRAGPVSPRV